MTGRTLASLCLVGLTLPGAACSGSPTEATAESHSALSGTIKPMLTWSEILTPSSDDGQITNGNGGCLDLPNGDTTNGNLLHIWACDTSGWNQTWFVDRAGSIHYAANPEKCVDFPAQSLVNGVPTDETQLQIWDCNGASGPDQVWHFTLAGNIEFGADNAKCVELRNGSSANNTPVQVFDCNGTSGQTWQLAQIGTSLQGFQLQDANGACLEPLSSSNGASLILAQCNGTVADQQWFMDGKSTFLGNYPIGQSVTFPSQDITSTTFVPETQLVLGGGTQVAMSSSNHTVLLGGLACMEARGGYAATGTVVQGFTCNGTSGQTWFPKPMGGTCPGTVAGNGTCNPCGAMGEPACASGCNAGLQNVLPANVCAQVLTGNTSVAAYGNGAVVANVKVTAYSNGTLTVTPTVTNSNQLTGFNYSLECHVGEHEEALVGYIGAAGFNLFGGSSTSNAPGTYGIVSPVLTADWPSVAASWSTTMQGSSGCTLTASAYSTLGADISALGADIMAAFGALAGAYLQAFQIGDPANGDLCMECTNAVLAETTGTDFCAQQCPNPSVESCGGSSGVSCEDVGDEAGGLE